METHKEESLYGHNFWSTVTLWSASCPRAALIYFKLQYLLVPFLNHDSSHVALIHIHSQALVLLTSTQAQLYVFEPKTLTTHFLQYV